MKRIIDIIKKYKFEFIYIIITFFVTIFMFFSTESNASSEAYPLIYLSMPTTSFTTDYKPNNNTRVVLDFEIDDLKSWSSYLGDTDTSFLIQSNSVSSSISFYYNKVSVSRSLSLNSGRHVVDINKGVLSIDNVEVANANSSSFFQSLYYLGLNNNKSYKPGIFNVYSFKIYENDLLVRDYQPYCLNGSYGFMECVNNNFCEVLESSGDKKEEFSLNLSVSSTEPTITGLHIYTQSFSDDILNNYKFYIKYPASEGSSDWVNLEFVGGITSDNKFSYFATENGVYTFRVDNENGETLSVATVKITNIVGHLGESVSEFVPTPQLHIYVENAGQDYSSILIRTQSFDISLIDRYSCIYWVSYQSDNPVYYPAEIRQEGDEFYFESSYHRVDEATSKDTYYFKFFDKELQRYGNHASLTIDRDYVLENADNYNKMPFWLKFIKDLFVPSDDFFSNNISSIKSNISSKVPYDDYVKMFGTIENISSDEDNITIDFPEYQISDNLTIKQDNFIDFSFVLKYRDIWYSWVRGFVYVFMIIYNINQITKLLRGINVSDAATAIGMQQPSPWAIPGQTSLFGKGGKN